MIWFMLIIPGMILAYALILRPFLRNVPRFKSLYDRADGFWQRVWALCGNSMTILWGYVLGGIGSAFALIDQLGTALGDPSMNLRQQVTDALKDHPEWLGYATIAISAVTIISRLRSMRKS